MMKHLLRHIPNSITSLNLIAGALAVILAIEGNVTGAGILICLAAIFDFLDGVAARLLNAYSEVGKELDSLADLISFGLAPAAIVFTLLKVSLFGENYPLNDLPVNLSLILLLIATLAMPVMSALRLARFNVKQSGENHFIGLPTPSNALIWVSAGFLYQSLQPGVLFDFLYSAPVLVILALITSALLVVNLPMFSLKFKSLSLKDNWYRYLFLLMSVVFLAAFQLAGLAPVMLSYILMNVIFRLAGVKY